MTARSERERSPRRRWPARRLSSLAAAALIAVALYLVAEALRQFTLDQVIRSLQRISFRQIGLAGLFTAASYLTLTGFDVLGVLYAGRKLRYPRIALASFVSLSIGHTVGLAPLSSGAIRYRFYSLWGLGVDAIVKIIVASAVTVALGELGAAATTALARRDDAARVLEISPIATAVIGGLCAGLIIAYLAAAAAGRWPIRALPRSWPPPRLELGLAQVAIGAVNYGFVTVALWQLIGPGRIDYPTAVAAYVLGNFAALLSHVPGGIGVLEAVIVALLPRSDVIGGLIAFRVIYFFVPLALGTLLFLGVELVRLVGRGRRGAGGASGEGETAARAARADREARFPATDGSVPIAARPRTGADAHD